jgi:hypothetical protein
VRRAARLPLALAALAAGCGSEPVSELPPPARPAASPAPVGVPAGRLLVAARAPARPADPLRAGDAVLDPRARTLRVGEERIAVGIGPTHVVAVGDRLYVADTRGGALLVVATRPRLAVVRRVHLPGSPYGLAADAARHRLWVTLTARNEVVVLAANTRPVPRTRWATVRQPDAVAVDSATGDIVVRGRDRRVVQVIGAQDADGQHQR